MKYISFLLHVSSIHGELYNCKSDDASVAAIEYRSNLDSLALERSVLWVCCFVKEDIQVSLSHRPEQRLWDDLTGTMRVVDVGCPRDTPEAHGLLSARGAHAVLLNKGLLFLSMLNGMSLLSVGEVGL
jgi:hypothetical protein